MFRAVGYESLRLRWGRWACGGLILCGLTSAATAADVLPGEVPPGALGSDVAAYRAPADPAAPPTSAPVFEEPRGTLTLRDAVGAALRNSPRLAAFSWEVRARDARTLQAGLLPNPSVSVEAEDVGGSGNRQGFEQAQTTISLAQLIELGGKRAKRRRLAALERDVAGWDYEVQRVDVLTGVAKRFVNVLALQARIDLAGQLLTIAERSVRTVGATVEAGAVSPVEAARAQVTVARTEAMRAQLMRELEAARAELASTWASRRIEFSKVGGNLEHVDSAPPLDALLAGMEANPDLARWTTELEQRRAAVDLEDARRIPDVTVGGGVRHFSDNGDNALVLGFSIPLPAFDRNQGGRLEAQNRLSQAEALREAAEATVRGDLIAAYERMTAAAGRIEALRTRILPEAERAFAGARDAYERGLFRYLEVLDAQRTLFELREEKIEVYANYHLAVADVERLSGMPIESQKSSEVAP